MKEIYIIATDDTGQYACTNCTCKLFFEPEFYPGESIPNSNFCSGCGVKVNWEYRESSCVEKVNIQKDEELQDFRCENCKNYFSEKCEFCDQCGFKLNWVE